MDKAGIANRLCKAGLRAAAEAYREEVRIRRKAAGEDRDKASLAAWGETWEAFRPAAEQIEKERAELKAAKEELKEAREAMKKAKSEAKAEGRAYPIFVGYEGNVDEIVDQNYNEPDAGNRLRDAFVWVGDEFRRITRDIDGGGTVMTFEDAKSPPPSPLAVQIAEFYGRHLEKREGLLNRLASFAAKQHTSTEQSTNEDCSILDSLG